MAIPSVAYVVAACLGLPVSVEAGLSGSVREEVHM